MGGQPLQALVTVVGASASMIEGLARGLAEAGAAYDCAIVAATCRPDRASSSRGDHRHIGTAGPVLRGNARPGDLCS